MPKHRPQKPPHTTTSAPVTSGSCALSNSVSAKDATVTLSADKTGIRSQFSSTEAGEVQRERDEACAPLRNRRNDPSIPFPWFSDKYPTSFAIPPPPASLVCCGNDNSSSSDSSSSSSSGQPEQEDQMKRYCDQWLQPIAPSLTLFERNPEVWAQLHSVVYSSHVVIIVADSRFPSMHLPLALIHFVCVEMRRKAVVVLNKADLVPTTVVENWKAFLEQLFAAFLQKHGVLSDPSQLSAVLRIVSVSLQPDKWLLPEHQQQPQQQQKSAAGGGKVLEGLRRKERKNRSTKQLSRSAGGGGSKAAAAAGTATTRHRRGDNALPSVAELIGDCGGSDGSSSSDDGNDDGPAFLGQESIDREERAAERLAASVEVLKQKAAVSLQHLLDQCKELAGRPAAAAVAEAAGESSATKQPPVAARLLSFALAAVPNAGKSSLLNALRGVKKVSVSSTAGHTKHKQTIILPEEDGVQIIDSPGLVFAQSGIPRPLTAMIGLHQVSQVRVPACAVAVLANVLPLERIYGLRKLDDSETFWSGVEICEALAVKKGFRVRGGNFDAHRAAVTILKDCFEGRLIVYLLPPAVEMATSIAETCFVQRFQPLK